MAIVLKREAKKYLTDNKDKILYLIIDGSLDSEYVKTCGCCGPPPSPDYRVDIVHDKIDHDENELQSYILVENIVPFYIDKHLFNAISVAKMNIVVFYIEDAGREENSGYLVVKLI